MWPLLVRRNSSTSHSTVQPNTREWNVYSETSANFCLTTQNVISQKAVIQVTPRQHLSQCLVISRSLMYYFRQPVEFILRPCVPAFLILQYWPKQIKSEFNRNIWQFNKQPFLGLLLYVQLTVKTACTLWTRTIMARQSARKYDSAT